MEERVSYENRDSSRWALERQYFEIIAFYLGQQWIEYTSSSQRFQRFSAPSWFPTPVDNKMKTRVHAMVSRLLRSRPVGRARPNSNELSDRQAAEVAEKFVEHIHGVTREQMLRQLMAYFAVLTGAVVVEDYFNPRLGQSRQMPVTRLEEHPVMGSCAACPAHGPQGPVEGSGAPCPECGQTMLESQAPQMMRDGQPAMEYERVPELDPETMEPMNETFMDGEIESRALMLFNFYWDPKAKDDLESAQWCGECWYADLDWIDQNFPEKGPYVGAQSGVDAASFYESSLVSLVGPSIQGSAHYGGGSQQFTDGAVVRKYQEKPSAKFPRGAHVITSNGVLLYRDDMPLRTKDDEIIPKFSYTMFQHDLVPGRLWGSTPCEDMVSLQRKINGIDCQIILNRKTLLNPWVLAPKGSGLNPGKTHMKPGATVLYNFVGVGAAPQVVQGTALPAQVLEERARAVEGIAELAEGPGTGAAQPPDATRSGVALHWQKEQIDEYGIARFSRWGEFHAERDRKRLLLAQRHYREQRAVKIRGRGYDWQISMFSGADLQGNTDVVVEPGSEIPRSRSAQTQILFDLIEAGVVDVANPVDRQKVIEEVGLTRFETDIGPDMRLSDLENAMMDQGQIAMVQPEHNDDVHAMRHMLRMKSPEFTTLPPTVQRLYRLHVAAHHEAKAAKEALKQVGAPTPAGEEPRAEVSVGGQPDELPPPPAEPPLPSGPEDQA